MSARIELGMTAPQACRQQQSIRFYRHFQDAPEGLSDAEIPQHRPVGAWNELTLRPGRSIITYTSSFRGMT